MPKRNPLDFREGIYPKKQQPKQQLHSVQGNAVEEDDEFPGQQDWLRKMHKELKDVYGAC